MSPGIRATVAFHGAVCPVVEAAATAGARIDGIAASVCPADGEASVSEFVLETDADLGPAVTPVGASGGAQRYRVDHDREAACPCECLGRVGCVVARYVATPDALTLSFHAADYEELREAVAALRAAFPDVDVRRLVRSPADEVPTDAVSVDRSKLTSRQLEVLETAHEMGYFERPRRTNATEIAAALDINPSTFSEHLAAAQRKLLGDVL